MKEKSEHPIAKHVKYFADENMTFSPTSVSNGLEKLKEPHYYLVGTAVSTFNASHVCPFSKSATFDKDKDGSYRRFFHLGTTRIWSHEGLDETRWEAFEKFVCKGQEDQKNKRVRLSKVLEYLQECSEKDVEELTTGRNTNSFFSSKSLQCTAAVEAWKEVFKLISVEAIDNDPCLPLETIREFFEDSTKLFENHKISKFSN